MKITNEVGCRCLHYNNDNAHGLQCEYKLGK